MDDMNRVAEAMNDRHRYTVAEMMDILSQMDPNAIVILARDAEGNGYYEFDSIDSDGTMYIPDRLGHGEIKYAVLTDEMKDNGYGSDDLAETGQGIPCVVLYPR